jgi:hypothetical protein
MRGETGEVLEYVRERRVHCQKDQLRSKCPPRRMVQYVLKYAPRGQIVN